MERLRVHIVLDIVYRLRRGQSERAIAKDLGHSRTTIRKYHEVAKEKGFIDPSLPLPIPDQILREMGETLLPPPSNESTVEPYREVVKELLTQGVEMAVIHTRLQKRHGYSGSYSSIRRFVSSIRPKEIAAFVRIEVEPGKEAQVDFGSAGKIREHASGKVKQAYCFVMTLSHSRHQYVEFVFDQKMETWIGCHRRAFQFFGGMPRELVIDNLKAAVISAALDNPVLSEPYRRMAQHYGILIHPCRVRTPEHKGKVENGVHYVKRNFLAGEEFLDIDEANRKVKSWITDQAGARMHGTTHEPPMKRFLEVEKSALLTLPEEAFEMLSVRQVKLHPDCHVEIDASYYSAPFGYIGRRLEAHVYERVVQIYYGIKLLTTHERAKRRGERITRIEHYPPEKAIYLMRTPKYCIERSEKVGPKCHEAVMRLLSERPMDNLRAVQHLIGLMDKYGPERLEAACTRALHYQDARYRRIKGILESGLDAVPIPGEVESKEAKDYKFARRADEFFGQHELLLGEVSVC